VKDAHRSGGVGGRGGRVMFVYRGDLIYVHKVLHVVLRYVLQVQEKGNICTLDYMYVHIHVVYVLQENKF
jgi:hypothetical protein